ncbi:protein-histidine kinase [Rhizoctonia solani]|uniref:Protein-histidine kinase n=1 Tax=Rhizoctonia solani TaxID=456999 RepID=A0A0K6G7Q4_9AGAM|nr:protein-histidine kinase [Rhizoctonia solani]
MLSSVSRTILSALTVGTLLSQTSAIAVNLTYFNPAPNVPEGFTAWLTQVAYPLTESADSSDGQLFVNTFAGNGEQGTLIIGANTFKGPSAILSAWASTPKLVKSLEHYPSDVLWDGGSKYSVFGLVKYAQLDGGCSQKSYATQFVFDCPGVYDGHLTIYHDWLSNCGLPGNLACNATVDLLGRLVLDHLPTATTAPMLASTDTLHQVPLVGFLDAYPEPAFILCSNTGPRSSLEFLYGNSSLRELLVGHDESGILDDQTFFSAVASDEDIFWLSDPTQNGSQSTSRSVSDSHVINLRPAWLPRDHTSVDLELTPTPIDLPMTIPNVSSSGRSYVFTATPRKAPMSFLRSENQSETRRKKDLSLRLPDFPLMPGAVGPHIRSRMSKSDSSSMLSQSAVINPAELPTRLVDTYPWETTPLGSRESWPVLLELMVKYLMETPVSASLLWGWPHQVIIYNDEYAKMIGSKHPRIFGKAGPVAWGELWDVLAAVSEGVRAGKATCKADDLLFFSTLTELHLPEEFYHSWHWTPVWQEDGTVAGIFNITWETTQKVIAERRLSCMSELSSRLSDAKTQQQFGERTLEGLSRNPLDLPFVALYWCDVEETLTTGPSTAQGVSSRALDYIRNPTTGTLNAKLTLAGSIGIPDDHPIAPPTIKYTLNPLTFRPHLSRLDSGVDVGSPSMSDATSRANLPGSPMGSVSSASHPPTPSGSTELGLDLTKVFASGSIEIVDPLPVHLAQGLDGRGFKDLPRMVAMVPISTNSTQSGRSTHGRTLPCGILLIGLNTRRQYDADYASWLESVGAGLSNQLSVVLQREADMRMMEERERMDKAKTMFFTNVSHELRTPLTLIQAPLEQLLTSSNLSNDTQYKLQLAVRNSRRLKKLIDSIMDMSKLEAGRLVGNFRPVHLSRITADFAALFRSMAEKKGIDYRIDCDAGVEPSVYVDIDLWEKIVCNLLSNAFKYTPRGSITLAVKHEATVSHATIQGVGIPKEYIDQVFDRFFRVNTNTAEGTGVGLSLTKELVSLHGGTMSVESCTEEECSGHSGSTFTVTLPHGSSHLPAALIHDAVHPGTHSATRKEMDYWMELEQPTPSTTSVGDEVEGESATSSTLFFEKDDVILVVDDNADMRSYVRKIFTPYLTVLEAHDGVEALRVARSQRLNLVLCDVMMPHMDGPEFLRRLREERRTKLIPVIFVTASDDASLFGGQTDGAVDYINKPFKVKDLLARAHLQLQLGKRRVKLEEDFEVRSHELQVLTDLSPVGIFRTDVEGRLMYANPAWHQIIGFPLRQDKDEWIDYVCPSSKEDMLYIWGGCFEFQRSSSKRVQWKNDCWTHVAISPLISPEGHMLGAFGAITDINEQHRAEEVRISLAEEREHMAATRAEEAEAQRQLEVERRRAQELLIDVTSHELRQPVSAIIQNAEVVRTNMKGLRDILHDCQRRKVPYSPTDRMLTELEDDLQAMDSIKQCGLAQARIANDVLSLSRMQLNVLSIIPSDFDIRRETNQILIVFRNELMSKNIGFELSLGRGADMYGLQIVTTDRSRYAQIITNLMSNAIRFTDTSTGLREIKVSLELSFDPPLDDSCAVPPLLPKRLVRRKSGSEELDVYIYVSVQDSGPGLQKEDLALLFQRFQQGSNAHHVFGGSGLGLFVCRQLCHLMGGRIEVVSEPGQGATFRFFIRATAPGISGPSLVGPRLKRSASVQSRASKASRTSRASRTSKASAGSGSRPLPETPNHRYSQPLHILITEDNKINQTVLARQMKRAGFTFSLASNGLEALQAVEQTEVKGGQKFDVILMDLEMPVLDGFATTREIRRREEAGIFHKRNFIISITGNARSEQVQSARDAGVDDVIIKPYQIDALISKMRAGSR